MVLEDLGASITKALAGMASKAVIDEDAVNAMLKDLQRALLLADVNVALVRSAAWPRCFKCHLASFFAQSVSARRYSRIG